MERNEVELHATRSMDIENTMLGEINQPQKAIYGMIPFI